MTEKETKKKESTEILLFQIELIVRKEQYREINAYNYRLILKRMLH